MGKGARLRRQRQSSRPYESVPARALDGAEGPTERLRALVSRRCELERAIEREVDRLAAAGVGWPVIAAALGVSRQGARQASMRRRERAGQRELSSVSI